MRGARARAIAAALATAGLLVSVPATAQAQAGDAALPGRSTSAPATQAASPGTSPDASSAGPAAADAPSGAAVPAGHTPDAPEPTPPAVTEPGVLTAAAEGVLMQTRVFGLDNPQRQSLDVYVPADAPLQPRPTLLLIHGGSWQIGDKGEWRSAAIRVVREQGWTAVSLNYRLAPAAKWPAPYDDVVAAVRYLREHAIELGVDPNRMAALGDSAGGHLAALLGRQTTRHAPLSATVSLSGVHDLPGLFEQPSSGGCPGHACAPKGLALKVQRDLMGCSPTDCLGDYRAASPAVGVTRTSSPVMAFVSESELIDARQAWAMDAALARAGRSSRVVVWPGRLHARGYLDQAWSPAIRWLAAHLQPETVDPYPVPAVTVTLDLPRRAALKPGQALRFRGVVSPRMYGSSVAVQHLGPDGRWRTSQLAPLRKGEEFTYYDAAWTPRSRGTSTWRVVWKGSGTTAVSHQVTAVVS